MTAPERQQARRRPQRPRSGGVRNEKRSLSYGCCGANRWTRWRGTAKCRRTSSKTGAAYFSTGGTQSLKKRVDPEERELKRVQAKLGEVMMRLELAEGLLEKKGYGAELRKRGR